MKKQLFYNRAIIFWSCLVVLLVACNSIEKNTIAEQITKQSISYPVNQSTETIEKYDLNNPVVCPLPSVLMEISALTHTSDSRRVYSVNDEQGIIYELDDCKISNEYKFDKKGDYEGVELVKDQIFVLKSNGNLIQFDTNLKKKTKEIRSPLSMSNDAEGLAYNQAKGLLLIACKGSANFKKHKKLKKTKAVYAYDVVQDSFLNKPFLVIEDEDIKKFFEKSIDSNWSKKQTKKRLKRSLDFSPSAIAQNPLNNNYYLLSSIGKSMIVLSEDNEILDLSFLDHNAYIQPEGLCFDKNGIMYISNEGRGLQSNILKITL